MNKQIDVNSSPSPQTMEIALLQERIKTLDELIVGLAEDCRRIELQILPNEEKAASLSVLAVQLQKIKNFRSDAFMNLSKIVGGVSYS